MIEWLKMMFHRHRWVVVAERTVVTPTGRAMGTRFIQQCNVCGKMHHYDAY